MNRLSFVVFWGWLLIPLCVACHWMTDEPTALLGAGLAWLGSTLAAAVEIAMALGCAEPPEAASSQKDLPFRASCPACERMRELSCRDSVENHP